MSIVISSSYVISASASGGGVITADNPLIGYDNITTEANIASTTEDADFPADNLANPATHLRWKGTATAIEYLTVLNPDAADLDYIAVARHNWFTAQIAVSVEYLTLPSTWTQLIAPVILPNDGPALFRFPKIAYSGIRLKLAAGTAAPNAAVVYCGALLVLQRRMYVGHTPITLGRTTMQSSLRSVNGNFLGRVVLGRKTSTQIMLQNLTPDWYRAYMAPFVLAAEEIPFFFAWRPSTYSNEIGYAWLSQDPVPKNQRTNGMMQVDLSLEGVI
jgi:hypothetical protein